jgi:crossover junction endodeoxyribonuclease RuvC
MLILGLDPGSTRVGYGLIKKEKNKLTLVSSGLLKIVSKNKAERLINLEKSASELMKKHRPDLVAIERLYFVKNLKTGLEVAQSRGVLTLVAARYKIPQVEYTPSEIKLAVTGYGNADKKSVAKMVVKILGINKIKGPDDVSDALATAICASHKGRS